MTGGRSNAGNRVWPTVLRRVVQRGLRWLAIGQLLSLPFATPLTAAEVGVYILTGQSNSLGTTNLESPFEPGAGPDDANTEFFWSNVNATNTAYPPLLYGDSNGETTTLRMQQGDDAANPTFWGPEFGFARRMADAGVTHVFVIKASRGGGGNTLWDKSAFDAENDAGHMWGHLRDTVDAALEALADAHAFDVKGLMYLQGESNDAGEAQLADTRLNALAANLKTHINATYPAAADKMHTVVGEIAASGSNANRALTKQKHISLATNSPDFTYVATNDLPLKSDGIHFGRDAKLTIGQRFADALIAVSEQPNGVPGDVNQDGAVSSGTGNPATDDVAAFIAVWQSDTIGQTNLQKTLAGDLNLSGQTTLADAFILHQALEAQGLGFPFAELARVPEPASSVLLALGVLGCCAGMRFKRNGENSSRPLLILLATAGIAAAAVSVEADQLDVYILTGQSNSLGTTNLEGVDYNPGSHPADAETAFFWSNVAASNTVYPPKLYGDSGGALTSLQMQQGDGVSPNFWGPEFGLARTFFDSGKADVMIVKASRGGGGNSLWDQSTFEGNPNDGHMWGHLRDSIDAALQAAHNAGHTFKVKGFMYLQGESNNSEEASIADTRLQSLIANTQAHINAEYADAANDLYSVVGEIAASGSNANRATTTNMQRALGATGSEIAFFRTGDLPIKGDQIHFGRDAKLEIGRRFADAFNSAAWVENPNLLAGYSANEGSLTAIPQPIAQGLLSGGTAAHVSEAVNDAGVPAWRNADTGVRSPHPGQSQSLNAQDFQQMFDGGWYFRTTVKVVSGGGSALWSVAGDAADPGWGISSGEGNTNGVKFHRMGDELQVGLWQDESLVSLGPGSADLFHTFELRGASESSLFDFYIDGQLHSAGHDLTATPGLSRFPNTILFRNDLTTTPRDVYWNKVSLVVPEPACGALLAACGALLLAGLSRSRLTCRKLRRV